MAIGNERFRKEMAKRQEKREEEKESMKKLFDKLAELGDDALPKPLPADYVPNAKFMSLMAERRSKLGDEQKTFEKVSGLPLPTLIEKSEDKKEQSS